MRSSATLFTLSNRRWRDGTPGSADLDDAHAQGNQGEFRRVAGIEFLEQIKLHLAGSIVIKEYGPFDTQDHRQRCGQAFPRGWRQSIHDSSFHEVGECGGTAGNIQYLAQLFLFSSRKYAIRNQAILDIPLGKLAQVRYGIPPVRFSTTY